MAAFRKPGPRLPLGPLQPRHALPETFHALVEFAMLATPEDEAGSMLPKLPSPRLVCSTTIGTRFIVRSIRSVIMAWPSCL